MYVSIQNGTNAGWKRMFVRVDWKCPKCGTENAKHWGRCPKCMERRPDGE